MSESDAPFAEIVSALGYAQYRPGPVVERIRRRMTLLGFDDPGRFGVHLRSHPEELDQLRTSVPISHTTFFRDPQDWRQLAEHVIPALVSKRERLRIWSAGCSSGEEAYSLAMLFAEHVGLDHFARRVTLIASDRSAASLATARSGQFGARRLGAIPTHLREKYFRDGVAVDPLRRAIRFVQHDLIGDPPFMHIDLLTCRNVLLYFGAEAKQLVLSKLWFGLADHGTFFTGPADGISLYRHMFRRTARHMHARRPSARREAMLSVTRG